MVRNADRTTISNGVDRIVLFADGRVKVWSRRHDWSLDEPIRHNALGESIRVRPGNDLGFDNPPRQEEPQITVALDPDAGDAVADTVIADNGTFVELFHDGSVVVGNDGRDLLATFNTVRATDEGGASARGGAVMIRFAGTYRTTTTRSSSFPTVVVPEIKSGPLDRPYKGEREILQNKIRRDAARGKSSSVWS